ncbi:MAG: hypothetical protein IJT05_02090 [Lachnospiraceae bacterium]|nr:hypothetical protein [Lachnospiraceae bacterium]
MGGSRLLLIRTLMKATGSFNRMTRETDKKAKGRNIASFVGILVLYALLAVFCVSMSVLMSMFGNGDMAPVLVGTVISALGFITGLLRSNGYLFAARDYNTLMSLPFTEGTIVTAKAVTMYLHNIPFSLVISFSSLVGYSIVNGPNAATILLWVILSFFVPLIPMVIGALIGAVSTMVSSGFKHKSVIQSVLIFGLSIFFIVGSQLISRSMSPDMLEQTMATMTRITDSVGKVLPTVGLFSRALTEMSFVSALILAAVSTAVFELVFFLISRNYRKINTKLLHRHKGKDYTLTTQKSSSVLKAIVFKEWRRFVGSSVYLTNIGMGQLLGLLVTVLFAVLGPDAIITFITRGHAVEYKYVIPIVPAFLYFLICMGNSAVVSLSLEGKSFWILQSLPIPRSTVYRGKMAFNILITLPFFYLGCIVCGIRLHASAPDILLSLLVTTGFTLFSTVFGILLGIRFMNLSWENEAEVVKRGTAMSIYIIVHLIISLAMCVLFGLGGAILGTIPTLGIFSGLFFGVTLLLYMLFLRGKE